MDPHNTDDESNNIDDVEARPLKKPKCKHMDDCDLSPSPLSPTPLSPSSLVTYTNNINSSDAEMYDTGNFESDKVMNDKSVVSDDNKEEEQHKEPYNVEASNVDKIKCSESNDFESDQQINGKIGLSDDDKQPEEHEKFKVDQIYDYLPQDYSMTDIDYCAQITIETSLATEVLVKIDEIFVTQARLLCLLDPEIFLNDDVISAYICCIKDQAHIRIRNDVKYYFENPFISVILKGNGHFGVKKGGSYVTEIVKNYLKHDVILIPINIKDTHWYLAIINAREGEIQVLDSLCWGFNRSDLTATLQGIQYHLDFTERQQNLINHNWKDLQITTWTITEKLQEPLQKDGSSCGLFMLKFMEYWTGDALSHPITQKDIDHFRYKLAGILLCWKTNTASMTPHSQQIHDTTSASDDVAILESPYTAKEANKPESLPDETKYQSLMSVLFKMGEQELVAGLCNYIKSINCAETLEKIWVQNSKPYRISLTLRKLQEILKHDLSMDRDCFNLVIRKFISDDIKIVKKAKATISNHYLDMQFWMITDFGRHPNFRKKLDVEQLAESVRSWPGINYSVSKCKSILIPIVESSGAFILIVLNQDTRTVYILDPTPLDPIYKYNPNARYVKKNLWIAEYLPKAMAIACPGSTWNEDIFLWRQITLQDVPIQNRELSGYLVSLFMRLWKNEELQLPVIKDDYEIRKQFMAQLLTYKENECEYNMPTGVRDFIRCISATQI